MAGIDDRGCTEKVHYAELLVNHLQNRSKDDSVDRDCRNNEKKDPVKISPISDKPIISPPQPPAGAAQGGSADDDID